MIRRTAFTVAGIALLALAAVVVVDLLRPAPPLSLSQQAAQLEGALRCPDCQGLSIAESHTTSASAIRTELVSQLQAGRTPAQVRAYFVARYGEWILLEPSSAAWFLLPFAVIALAAIALVAWLRASRPAAPDGSDGPAPPAGESGDAAARRRVRDEVEALDA
jgi:cytochrome c-type biogenesis protein CcmH